MTRSQSSLMDGFTDDWDAALLSEGTLRPTRAASAMNLREVMAKLKKSPAEPVTKEDLENQFSRSMKLLGLERAGSAPNDKNAQKPKLRNVSPRTVTRLNKPTVSYEDIRNAVADGVDRKVLSQAAYERWYFSKLEKERESRQLKGLFDLDKRSKLFEHGLTFSEWFEKKEKERKLKKANPEPNPKEKKTRRRVPISSEAAKEAAEKAYREWLEKKNAEETRRKQKLKEEAAAKNANKTREDAEKAFEEWKRSCDEKLRKLEFRRKKKERKLTEKEQSEKERHLQDCEKAFNAWLSSKNQSILEHQEKIRKQLVKKSIEEQKRLEEKKYEAKQAFEDWLEKKLEEEASRVPLPDPKVTKAVQTEAAKPSNYPKNLMVPWSEPARPSNYPKNLTASRSEPARPSHYPKNLTASRSEPSNYPKNLTASRSEPARPSNFPKNLKVPWSEFSTRNSLTPQKFRRTLTPTRRPKVKFADSFDSDVPADHEARPPTLERYKDFTKIRELSDNKSIMMMYHKKDPNCALYYARDLI